MKGSEKASVLFRGAVKTLDMKSVMWVGHTRSDLFIRLLFVEGSL